MSDQNHSANYIVSTFLLSKRSTKKIFRLNMARIGLLRYLCDSMDMAYKKIKKLATKLYQSQICRHCHIDRTNLTTHLKILIKKKFIKFDPITKIYSLGLILLTWGKSPHSQDMRRNTSQVRYEVNHHTSYSSNITNTPKPNSSNQKPKSKTYEGPAPTAEKMSPLMEEFMKSGRLLNNRKH